MNQHEPPHTPSESSPAGVPGREGPGLGPEDVEARKAAKGERNKARNKKTLKVVGFVLGGFLIFGIGAAAGGSGNDSSEEIETIKEVEIEVPGETETVVEEVEVEVAPEVCIDAIDKGSEIIGSTGPIFSELLPEALDAAWDHDTARIEALTVELSDFNDDFVALGEEYNTLKVQCAVHMSEG